MKYMLFIMSGILLIGCGNITGDTITNTSNIDNSVDNTTQYFCKDNNDTQCYTSDYSVYKDSNGSYDSVSSEVTNEYSKKYNEQECAANGYFWCNIKNKCLNVKASKGTCK